MTCNRAGKLIGGCRWEPVFDATPPAKVPPKEYLEFSSDTVLKLQAMTAHTFAGSLCRTCGAIQKRADL